MQGWLSIEPAAAAWYRRNRARSRELFDLLVDEAYYSQPIALRHPIVFYEGHLPGFSFNTLVKKGLGRPSIDARLETLFARGIDPHEATAASTDVGRVPSDPAARAGWPARDEVHAFADEADRQVIDALMNADVDRPGDPLLDRAEAVFTILEHEVMHQETLLYMWHRLPLEQKRKPAGYRPRVEGVAVPSEWIEIPAGCATLGVPRGTRVFGWDNEYPALSAQVPAFSIERHDVTNARYLEFVDAGGYRDPQWWRPEDWAWVQREAIAHPLFWERDGDRWLWRGMFERVPLPVAWPVYRQPGGGIGVRALARRAAADRGGVPARRVRIAGRRAPPSVGRGAARRRRTASSISRAGIPKPPAAILRVRARGASRIWSATAGNGRARRSGRFPASRRWPRIPSTRRTSSMANTSS